MVPSEFARQLEREIVDARKERDAWAYECGENMKLLKETIATATRAIEQRDTLAEAVRSFVTDYEQIQWGYDGDGGSQRLVDHLFEALAAVKGGKP
jgi:hypothetical protein